MNLLHITPFRLSLCFPSSLFLSTGLHTLHNIQQINASNSAVNYINSNMGMSGGNTSSKSNGQTGSPLQQRRRGNGDNPPSSLQINPLSLSLSSIDSTIIDVRPTFSNPYGASSFSTSFSPEYSGDRSDELA